METESGKFHWSKIPLRGVLFPMVVARPHNHQNDSPPSPSPPLTSYSRHFHWFLHLTPSLCCNVSCLLGISKIGSFPQLTDFLPLQLCSAHHISFPTHALFLHCVIHPHGRFMTGPITLLLVWSNGWMGLSGKSWGWKII